MRARLTALFPWLPRWAGTRKVKPIWILLKQETVSGSGIRWDICKSAPSSREKTMPAPHHSVFYRLDALPAAQPTASKHWRSILLIVADQLHTSDDNICTYVAWCWCVVAAAAGRVVRQSSDTGRLLPAGPEHHQRQSAGRCRHRACHKTDVGGTWHGRQTAVDTERAGVVTDVTRRHHGEVRQRPGNTVGNCRFTHWPVAAAACCRRLPVSLVHWTEPRCQGTYLCFQ